MFKIVNIHTITKMYVLCPSIAGINTYHFVGGIFSLNIHNIPPELHDCGKQVVCTDLARNIRAAHAGNAHSHVMHFPPFYHVCFLYSFSSFLSKIR